MAGILAGIQVPSALPGLCKITYRMKNGPSIGKSFSAIFVKSYYIAVVHIAELLNIETMLRYYMKWDSETVDILSTGGSLPSFLTSNPSHTHINMQGVFSVATLFPSGFQMNKNVVSGTDVLGRKWTMTHIINNGTEQTVRICRHVDNEQSYANLEFVAKRGRYKCSKCGQEGHNQRKCPSDILEPAGAKNTIMTMTKMPRIILKTEAPKTSKKICDDDYPPIEESQYLEVPVTSSENGHLDSSSIFDIIGNGLDDAPPLELPVPND